jgi:hypothetical protein
MFFKIKYSNGVGAYGKNLYALIFLPVMKKSLISYNGKCLEWLV